MARQKEFVLMNILLIDDREIDRELIKHALHNAEKHFDITEVDNPCDGLSQLQQSKFDVVLIDYQLPKMTGVQILLELQKQQQAKDIVKIIISNNGDEDLMLECINAGAQDFLLKQEVTPRHLTRSIKQSHKRLELEKKLYLSYHQVKDLAEHDQLTGLYNRYHFEESLRTLLVNQRSKQGHLAVMLMDLDNFKLINDTFGHAVGDKLLVELANRVKSNFREGQLFARLGGDEFAFVFTGIEKVSAIFAIANRILALFKKPFDVDEHQIYCQTSIGISMNFSSYIQMEELVKYADIAMYRAKNKGKHQFCLFEDDMESEFLRSFRIENELRKAIKDNEFELYFQPIYKSQTREICACEALIRWPSGQTTQNPNEFIPIAEQTRLIEPLGRWIISQAISQLAAWQEVDSNLSVKLAINLSPLQIHDLNITKVIQQQAQKYQVNPDKIVIEITETALLENNEATVDTLNAFKSLGCSLALDDFGTGYSSISHLLLYPIDVVKFDKSLLDGALTSEKKRHVIEGLTNMLNSIGIRTVAEGAELMEQADLCENIGVSSIQGYVFAKPMTAIEVYQQIKAQSEKSKISTLN